ncbi:MAG: hypothetical protein LCH41_12850 [Armatimonadetes bacterium]|nr:hypothetical protein [Armatimonadota bacterium]
MKAMWNRNNLVQAVLFALVIAWVNVMGSIGFILDQRYEFVIGILQWMVPVAFVARLLSAKLSPFDRHPVITTSGVFASCVVAISIFNQAVQAPETNFLISNAMTFVACLGIAVLSGGICWLIEQPWRGRHTRSAA